MLSKGVFFNTPAYGHVNPTLMVVKEIVDRGGQVDYYCSENFREIIEQTGSMFLPIPNDLIKNEHWENFNLLAVGADLMKSTAVILPRLLEKAQSKNYDYILVDFFSPWGRIIAEKLGLPVVVFFPCFALHKKLSFPFEFTLQVMTKPIKNLRHFLRLKYYFNKLKQKHQLNTKDIQGYFKDLDNCLCVVFTSREFQPLSELFKKNYHFVGASLESLQPQKSQMPLTATDLPNDAMKNKQVIYISLGSICSNEKFYRTCIKAFSGSHYLVLLNISPYLKVENFSVPQNIIVRSFFDQLEILAKASLFITHGGMNSVHEGIFFEVPLIVVPQVSDQFLVAKRVTDKGLGVKVNARFVSPKKLLQVANQVIKNQEIKKNLKKMNKSFKEAGGFKKTVDVIEKWMESSL